jgi:dTDP-glucose pyrophosphorylase
MIVIPMAGNSSRFYQAGYDRPKYELPLGGEPLFAHCVRSFQRYFGTERFVFVCRSRMKAERFIEGECDRLGIEHRRVIVLEDATHGQAETVLRGIEGAGAHAAESLLIFNIDTIRPDYGFPPEADLADGYLEVFSGCGEHWSFVRPAASFSRRVAQTTEKQRISGLCSTGLYHFARCADYTDTCNAAMRNLEQYARKWGELYIAPLYNALIERGQHIVYHEISKEQVVFAGTPREYEALLERQQP